MGRSESSQHLLQSSDLDTGTKQDDSVFEQFSKFMQFWKDGQKASFKIECEDGEVLMNLSVCLKNSRKTRHSPSKIRRNRLRAEKYRKQKQKDKVTDDAKQLQEHFDVNNEMFSDINSDFNGNEVSNCLSLDNDYQFCFMDDEYSDDFNINSSNLLLGQDLQTELFASDREETKETDEDEEVVDDREVTNELNFEEEDEFEHIFRILKDEDPGLKRWNSHPGIPDSELELYSECTNECYDFTGDIGECIYLERTGKWNLSFMNDPEYRHHFLKWEPRHMEKDKM